MRGGWVLTHLVRAIHEHVPTRVGARERRRLPKCGLLDTAGSVACIEEQCGGLFTALLPTSAVASLNSFHAWGCTIDSRQAGRAVSTFMDAVATQQASSSAVTALISCAVVV